MIKNLKQIGILAWKDVLIDLRRKENLLSMFFFSLTTIILFNFAIGENTRTFRPLVPGIMWVIFLLAGVLGLGKAFQQEAENDSMNGLLLTPISRGSLFLGKMFGTTMFLSLVQLFVVPLFVVFFDMEPVGGFGPLALAMLAGTIGFTALGTLLAGMTSAIRGREVMLPILLFPLIVPNLISVVKITSFIFFGGDPDPILSWWKLLIGFDTILCVFSYLCFEFVLED